MIGAETISQIGSVTEHVRQGQVFFVAPESSTPRNWLNAIFPHVQQKNSPQEAHDAMVDGRGDVALIADGEYDETGTHTLQVTKSNCSFIALSQGVLPRAILKPLTQNKKALVVDVDVRKVSFVGIGFEPDLTAGNPGIDVAGSDIDFSACKFAGDDGDAFRIGGGVDDAAARIRILYSEFEWADRHLVFKVASGTGNLNTEIEVRGCRFHNAITRSIGRLDVAGSVQGSWFIDCDFMPQEGGAEPTKYLELDGASEVGNHFSGLRFATANQTSAKMLVTATSRWLDCWTEAGVSAAHPS